VVPVNGEGGGGWTNGVRRRRVREAKNQAESIKRREKAVKSARPAEQQNSRTVDLPAMLKALEPREVDGGG
jgi:hypothetical protein